MVPTSKQVREVYLGKNGVLSAFDSLDKGSIAETIIMDEPTIEQAESIDVARTRQAAGAEMVDAPVHLGRIWRCFGGKRGDIDHHGGRKYRSI